MRDSTVSQSPKMDKISSGVHIALDLIFGADFNVQPVVCRDMSGSSPQPGGGRSRLHMRQGAKPGKWLTRHLSKGELGLQVLNLEPARPQRGGVPISYFEVSHGSWVAREALASLQTGMST